MAAIRHSLQKEVCDLAEEQLLGVLHVTKPGKKKKTSFLCAVITKEKPVNALIHQVKKTDKESFKKKNSWHLRDLLVVDGKDENKDTAELDLTFERVYKWTASSAPDKNSFVQILWRLSCHYLPKQKPQFVNVPRQLLLKQDSLRNCSDTANNTGLDGSTSPDAPSLDGSLAGDYSAVSVREQRDLQLLMTQCSSAVSNAEAFAQQLAQDLSLLDGANIHSMMASEAQVEALLSMIDAALEEAGKIEGKLDSYDSILLHVKDTIHKMADKTKCIEQSNENNTKLLEELQQVIYELELPIAQEQLLRSAELSNSELLPSIVEAAAALQAVLSAPLPPHLHYMQAVKDQKKKFEKLRARFCQLVSRHLNNLFIHLGNDPGLVPPASNVAAVGGMSNTLPYGSSGAGRVCLPRHSCVHTELEPYTPLMHWVRAMDTRAYQHLSRTYTHAISKLYDREVRSFFDEARTRVVAGKKLRGVSGTSNPDLSQSGGNASKLTSQFKQQAANTLNTGRAMATSTGRLLGVDKEHWGNELDMSERHKFDEMFECVLSELEPVCLAEQEFCITFFNLNSATPLLATEQGSDPSTPLSGGGPSDNSSVGGSSSSGSSGPPAVADSSALTAGAGQNKVNTVNKEVRTMMAALFTSLEQQLTGFINTFDRADSYCCLYIYVRLSGHVLSAQDTGSFLSTTFGSALVQSKRNFDRFLQAQLNSIVECRVSKKKCAILPFVTNFEEFARTCECVFKRSERRADLERWHIRLLTGMLDTIPRVAHDHARSPQEVIKMENYHVLHQVMSQLKLVGTEQLRKDARARYQDALSAYVTSYFGRPLEKLNIFFEGVAAKVASGVKESEVGYQLAFSKQELRKVIRDYPGREVKRGLEQLYKKVDKHLCEEGNLLQVVWRAMQEEFIRQYKAIEELTHRCYPDAQISLDFTINDILAYFSDIAQSH
uniref:Exocyst complex component 1-like n=3 Tax=Hirondellea gigas TaxID=1518452 RepID=A0A6A7G1L6_9CRUS